MSILALKGTAVVPIGDVSLIANEPRSFIEQSRVNTTRSTFFIVVSTFKYRSVKEVVRNLQYSIRSLIVKWKE